MLPKDLLASYPRRRPPLSEPFQKIYNDIYLQNREGKTLSFRISQWLESWMHRRVAAQTIPGAVLELGAGTLNHVAYETNSSVYDAVEPFSQLYEGRPERTRLRKIYSDVAEIPASLSYDRIISVAVLEHVLDLPRCVARCGLLLSEKGVFQAGIPSEGGFLWGLTWRMSVAVACKIRTGLDYGEWMRYEHINNAVEIIQIVRYFFHRVQLSYFPLPGVHASLYAYLVAHEPNRERCKQFLESFPH